MSKRNHDAALYSLFDKENGPVPLRSQGQEPNASLGRVLEPAKLIPIRRPHMLSRMRAARAVFGGDVRTFQMEPRDCCCQIPIRFASLDEGLEALSQGGKGIRDQGSQQCA